MTTSDEGSRPGPDGGPPRPPQPDPRRRWWIIAGIAFLVVIALVRIAASAPRPESLSYTSFLSKANAHEIHSVTVNNSDGVITGKLCALGSATGPACQAGSTYSATGPVPAVQSDMKVLTKKDHLNVQYLNPTSSWLSILLPYFIFGGLIILMIVLIGRQTRSQMTGIMSIGRSRAKLFSEDRPTTTFADVAGYHGVKQEISEVVDFLKSPARFRDIGAKIPKGVLLIGPPGTGKTLLARAVAGEAGVPFLSVSGSDFMEMFVGVGASRVRDLFQTARKQAPAIIFVDEIDSIGRKRGAGLGGGHDEREQTLNQMLSEMDGFDTSEGVVMIGATNRPDVLDTALLRPGRFDRQIVVPLPDLDERLPILQVHSRNKRMGSDVDLETVARGTPGMSGADLANLVNEAALHAVRRGAKEISMEDFENARDRVLMGQQRDSIVLGPRNASASRSTRAATRCSRTCCRRPTPSTRSRSSRGASRSASRCSSPPRTATSTRARSIEDEPLRAHGRPRRRAARLRRPLDGCGRRPRAQHRARPSHGPRVGHEQGDRADGVGLAGPGLPRGGPDPHPRLLRRHLEGDRRRGRADPARAGVPRDRRAHPAPARARRRRPRPARAETLDGETVGRLIDEAFGRPVYPDGRKVGSSLRPSPPIEPDDGKVAAASGSGGWAPPSIPSA